MLDEYNYPAMHAKKKVEIELSNNIDVCFFYLSCFVYNMEAIFVLPVAYIVLYCFSCIQSKLPMLSPVVKCHLSLILSEKMSYELNLF